MQAKHENNAASRVFHASVPDSDADIAAGLLHDPVGRMTDAPADTRVMSLMIHDRLDAAALDRLPRLDAVITRSDGHDHLPMAALRDRGVAAYHLGDYATQSVATLAVSMVLALLHRIPEAVATTRAGAWDRSRLVGRHLTELRLGVLGVGRIGGTVARHLQALGADVLGHDVRRIEDVPMEPDLHRFLAACDVVTIHVPLQGDTRHLLDGAALAHMRRGSLLVNTARGDVVDPGAVLQALDTGRLAGYAADVLPGEPDPPHLEALLRPDVLLTPHLGAHNEATLRSRYERTQAIVDALLAGRPQDVEAWRV